MRSLYTSLFFLIIALFLSVFWLFTYTFAPAIQGKTDSIYIKKPAVFTFSRVLTLITLLFLVFEFFSILSFIPSVLHLRSLNPQYTSIMNFRSEEPTSSPRFISFEKIPQELREGVLACEDYDFYNHYGYSPVSIKFALAQNLKQRSFVYGGSTITQQLARTLFLSPKKSLYRKYKELFISIELEIILSKDRILELYMNYAEWGPGIYGVYDASLYHFGKRVTDLTLDEYAGLLSILPNPLRWNTQSFHQNEMLERRWLQICSFYNISYDSKR